MKNSIVKILILFFWSISYAQKPEIHEIVIERHDNGLKKLVFSFEGKDINEELTVRQGFYDTGVKKFIESYNNNQKSGEYISWYQNGQKKTEGVYKAGKLTGLFTVWYENGLQKSDSAYSDGKLLENTEWEYFENENKKTEVIYTDGKKNGLFTTWYENGTKKSEQMYKDGERNGVYISWHEDGKPQSRNLYSADREDGLWHMWNSTGELIEEKLFSSSQLLYKKTFQYYSTGELYTTGINEDIIIYYTQDGNIQKETRNGQIWNGEIIHRYDSGAKKSKGNYEEGKEYGLFTT